MAQEKNFENKLKTYLKAQGAWFIKYWAGSAFTKEGIPDILACINGRFYGIEVKGPTGKPKLTQLVNLTKIRHAGGIGLLLYPNDFDEFKKFVEVGNDIWYKQNISKQNNWYKKLLLKT